MACAGNSQSQKEQNTIKTFIDDFVEYLLLLCQNKKRFIAEKVLRMRWNDFSRECGGEAATRYGFETIRNYLIDNNYIKNSQKKGVKGIVIISQMIRWEEKFSFTVKQPDITLDVKKFLVCTVCCQGFESIYALQNHCKSGVHLERICAFQFQLDETRFSENQNQLFCPIYLCKSKCSADDYALMNNHILTAQHFVVLNCAVQQGTVNNEEDEGSRTCVVCANLYPSAAQLLEHQRENAHKLRQLKFNYEFQRKHLIQDKHNVTVLPINLPIDATYSQGQVTLTSSDSQIEVQFLINTSKAFSVMIVGITFMSENVTASWNEPLDNGTIPVTISISADQRGKTTTIAQFNFEKISGEEFQVVREIVLSYVRDKDMHELLQPIIPSSRNKLYFQQEETISLEDIEFVPGVPPEGMEEPELKLVHILQQYPLPEDIRRNLLNYRRQRKDAFMMSMGLHGGLTYSNYARYLSSILYLEEYQQSREMNQFTIKNTQLIRERNSELVFLEVPGLVEKRPTVLKGDIMFATMHGDAKIIYIGYAHHVGRTQVKLGFHVARLVEKLQSHMRFTIEFKIRRTVTRLCHRAVQWAQSEENASLECVLFPEPTDITQEEDQEEPEELEFFDKLIETNPQQKQAVQCIVMGTSQPAPYLIFGPPGTGKTVTVVEAIKQVYKANSNMKPKILVCAPQNAAADVLTEKLLENDCGAEIFRIHAASRRYADISLLVRSVSNFRNDDSIPSDDFTCTSQVYYPDVMEIKKYDIVICTLITAGSKLASADISNHFTYIFIDEAGHATEPETMTGIAGLLDTRTGGQLVLAGDPKQLGPSIASPIAEEFGLGMSLLERLMTENPLYKRSEMRYGGYDRRVVTKLVRNFRSHPAILKVSNDLFYDGELHYHADNIEREAFCQWKGLPTKGFPVLFHAIHGEDVREGDSPSWFNVLEVGEVMYYVKLLMRGSPGMFSSLQPKDIGIITPYRKQAEKIRKALQINDAETKSSPTLSKIRVGSVEIFQGEERKVIIISTVRSTEQNILDHDARSSLGFLSNPKRFNVAITRAKALLIVVGNPKILCLDENWERFIQYCWISGGYVPFTDPPPGCSRFHNRQSHSIQNISGTDEDSDDSNHTE